MSSCRHDDRGAWLSQSAKANSNKYYLLSSMNIHLTDRSQTLNMVGDLWVTVLVTVRFLVQHLQPACDQNGHQGVTEQLMTNHQVVVTDC